MSQISDNAERWHLVWFASEDVSSSTHPSNVRATLAELLIYQLRLLNAIHLPHALTHTYARTYLETINSLLTCIMACRCDNTRIAGRRGCVTVDVIYEVPTDVRNMPFISHTNLAGIDLISI